MRTVSPMGTVVAAVVLFTAVPVLAGIGSLGPVQSTLAATISVAAQTSDERPFGLRDREDVFVRDRFDRDRLDRDDVGFFRRMFFRFPFVPFFFDDDPFEFPFFFEED